MKYAKNFLITEKVIVKEKDLKQKSSQMKKGTMLIVDDNEINRGILEEIFKDEYYIEQAENGQECLDKLLSKDHEFCAVLLDIVMPVMDGIQVLRELKEKSILSHIPVFLITAETNGQTIKDGYELGVMDIISKPVVPYMVRRRVDSVVELFQTRKQLNNTVAIQQSEISHQAQQIIDLNMGMIEALSAAIEFRSCESGSHVRRIHDITYYMLTHTKLGSGLTKEQINLISLGAIMHDVGKIAVSDTILNKPGRLTADEFEIMKTHTSQGADLLDQIPQMRHHETYQYAHDIALHHHERWDGKGYPEGLKGDEISVWSQIVALADVYDALVSKRVYKDAYTYDEALHMIQDGQCGTFNPELLNEFANCEPEIRKLYENKI